VAAKASVSRSSVTGRQSNMPVIGESASRSVGWSAV